MNSVMKQRNKWETAFYKALSERLRLTRKTLGISEQEAADAAGVSVKTYRKYEIGATTPQCDFMDFCCELDVSFNWLMYGEGNFLSERHYLDDLVKWVPRKGCLT